ncbi:ribokinase [Paenibacillus radicis (ex Xue et al. 2023)]|uniref:Ribokinase n=1 Tax=Paenibacillus radicis (ex Xue et al. 2023) TaxID=2972489 RepID=A0ABT1YNP3_9BACL|nr:ribokinase [Paenibacillus radicis (ex Xue et al. 2023)]MCR8634796.1 ribokinase [Paenibacillus radicis (ex Xue et al. 2023)]
MVQKVKIVVIGSLNMDLVVVAPRVALEGETIIGGKFTAMPGGKGANQAVAASRLGAQVHMVGCIGDDGFGRELREHLRVGNINTDYVTTVPDASSGVAMITVSERGENSIVVSPGANDTMTIAHVKQAETIIREADLVLIQLEIPLEVVEEAVAMAKKHQVTVILNPAPARQLSEVLLKQIDILTPNETEGRIIVTGQAEGDIREEAIISFLRNKGVQNVVMTLGGEGVAYSEGGSAGRLKAHTVEVVDTTGAGDSFNAGLGVYLAEGGSLEAAISFAQKVAALSVTKFGAQPSFPYRSQVDRFQDHLLIGGEVN